MTYLYLVFLIISSISSAVGLKKKNFSDGFVKYSVYFLLASTILDSILALFHRYRCEKLKNESDRMAGSVFSMSFIFGQLAVFFVIFLTIIMAFFSFPCFTVLFVFLKKSFVVFSF